jgi:hypothetical protein
VVTNSCAFNTSHAWLGVRRAPGFPCALCFSRDNVGHSSGGLRREVADAWLLGCLKIKSEIWATVSPGFAEATISFAGNYCCEVRGAGIGMQGVEGETSATTLSNRP